MSHQTPTRLPLIDSLRGVAITLMIAYHFCYDLTYFRFVQFDFYRDPFWLNARTLILSLFLLLVGVSLTLAAERRLPWRRYLRRLLIIGLCAGAISLSSYALFEQRWIFFGVLHFIAVASVIGLPFVRWRWPSLLLGSGLIALDRLYSHTLFDQPGLQWIGLMTHKPPTEDYVPLIPWFGLVLIGIFLGRTLLLQSNLKSAAARTPGAAPLRILGWAGRSSLIIYMLHQPILIGVLWLIRFLADGTSTA